MRRSMMAPALARYRPAMRRWVGEGKPKVLLMIELLFVACLSADPTSCRDRSLVFTDDISVLGCMMGAQSQLAKWAEAHPRQRITRWRCKLSDRSERAA